MSEIPQDRRRAKRVSASLNLEVMLSKADGSRESANLQAINISSSGVYFKSDHFIEPMTKLAMALEVAVPAADEISGRTMELISCEGLVVRTTPEAETESCNNYEIAVFFTNIGPDGLSALERHINLLVDDTD